MNTIVETCINNPVLRYMVEALLFISSDDEGEPLDGGYTICDFDKDCLAKLYAEFQQFIDKCEAEITAKFGDNWESLEDFYCGGYPDGCVERDFIYTRTSCGIGFWEPNRWDPSISHILTSSARTFSAIECYVGDDEKIYL